MAKGGTSQQGPILNSPYEEPARHYATDTEGALNYADVRKGRRIFAPDVPQRPIGIQTQPSLLSLNDLAAQYGEHSVNQIRREVGTWRESGYPGVTSRVTRDLLSYWFLNPERQDWHKLFFAQREAVETAIWLNELADKSNPGTSILGRLQEAQRTIGSHPADQLPRVAFKMATGTGKTVVMACLLLYHYLNRQEYRNDTRFADDFLIVAPGITIKDRLGVLFVDTFTKNVVEARDYYRQRRLVPRDYEPLLEGLNPRLVITNYHAFEPHTLSGNKRSPFDGKRDAEGHKQEALEDFSLVLKRVLGQFRPGRRLLVINDESHHCYLPRSAGSRTDDEDSATENERAAVWFSGLREIAQRFQVRAVYDLSATPYYLSGSGYPPYSLFPWVVSDFGLIEAIESGLVKIPFLPVSDSSQMIAEPVLKDIYRYCKDELPRKGQRGQRKVEREAQREGSEGKQGKPIEAPPRLPPLVLAALDQFYNHYRDYDAGHRERGERGLDLLTEPPVFIVVCSNTTVSKEVFKYIAGYEYEDGEGNLIVRPGKFDLFSNFHPQTLQPLHRPPTLLIDSDALENSGQIDEAFKKIFTAEIEQFKREYRIRHAERSVENITDAEILREVVNTVGKRGALGAHVRCVVSVSMLTEGWDANTVTHIMGLRAFGSQLLCEQVAGRALRRRHYLLDAKTGRFPPEYAHIIGVPFKLFKGGTVESPAHVDLKAIRALPEREHDYEISFPNLIGYRIEVEEGEIRADFSKLHHFPIDFSRLPMQSVLGNAFSPEKEQLEVRSVREKREQEVIYLITQQLIRFYYSDDNGRPYLQKFARLKRVVEEWYATKLILLGETDPEYRKAVIFLNPKTVCDHIQLGILAQSASRDRILPIFNYYNRFGSTRYVHGQTSKPLYATEKSHVNYVVVDSAHDTENAWEAITAKTLEQMAEVESYVKNAFLGFQIPYVTGGRERQYLPDFIARVRTRDDRRVNLIIEITGMNQDKQDKRWYVEHRWLPAVNAVCQQHGIDEWQFIEIANDIRGIKNQLVDKIRSL